MSVWGRSFVSLERKEGRKLAEWSRFVGKADRKKGRREEQKNNTHTHEKQIFWTARKEKLYYKVRGDIQEKMNL